VNVRQREKRGDLRQLGGQRFHFRAGQLSDDGVAAVMKAAEVATVLPEQIDVDGPR